MKKIIRLLIETIELDDSELRTVQRRVRHVLEKKKIKFCKDIFDDVQDNALHNGAKVWEAIKRADEIYSNSSLIPLDGGYNGSPAVMDFMMKKCIAENITGKSVIFLRPFKDIEWENIDSNNFMEVFSKNKLFTLEGLDKFKAVDMRKIKSWN